MGIDMCIGVPNVKQYGLEGNKIIVVKDRLGKRYGQGIFASVLLYRQGRRDIGL